MASLDGCLEKCRRADEHLELFQAEADTFVGSHPYAFPGKFQRKTKHYVFQLRIDPAPTRLGVLIGDAVHNLRSALDHLVYQLVLANGNEPVEGARGNSFPILQACPPGGFRQAMTQGRLQGVEAKAAAEIGRLQPYRRGNGGKRNLLCVLNRLWNADKHRLVHEVRASGDMLDPNEVAFELNRDAGERLVTTLWPVAPGDGAKVARLELAPAGPHPRATMDAQVSVSVTLDDGSPAATNLRRMSQRVARTIRDFERSF